MAGRIATALAGLAAQLTAAGVPASVEPGQVPVPGAWVQLQTIDGITLDGSLIGSAWVYLVAADTGTVPAHDVLGGLLDLVLDSDGVVVNIGEGDVVDTAQAVALPHTASPLPAYRLTVDLTID